jgi:hypothetical protein
MVPQVRQDCNYIIADFVTLEQPVAGETAYLGSHSQRYSGVIAALQLQVDQLIADRLSEEAEPTGFAPWAVPRPAT